MRFETEEMVLDILRDHYCYATPENGIYRNETGTEAMVLYWYYSGPDGWCSVSDEHIFVEDIRQLNKRLKELELGLITDFEMDFPQHRSEKPLMRIGIKRTEENYHLKLSIFDEVVSEYISYEHVYSDAEWEPYAREFTEWGRKLPVQLGMKARTKIHVDDNTFWLGREGKIVKIYPKEEKEDTLQVAVSFTDYGWDRKPYQSVRLYDIDEVQVLRPGEELKQDDLNRDLLKACTAEDPDFIRIERLLQQGAQPLGLTEYCNSKDYVYHAVIDEYNSYEEEDEIYPFYRITELFLQYGMDLSKPVVPYDDWDYLHPLWSFTFFHTNAILKVLKLLLDRGMDAHAARQCWGHDLMDLSIFPIHEDSDDDIHEYFEHELARLMLFASYPHILENDPDLQKEIQRPENDYDPINFRNWEKFFFRVDTSKRPNPTRLGDSVITIFERGTGKEVWKFVFE